MITAAAPLTEVRRRGTPPRTILSSTHAHGAEGRPPTGSSLPGGRSVVGTAAARGILRGSPHDLRRLVSPARDSYHLRVCTLPTHTIPVAAPPTTPHPLLRSPSPAARATARSGDRRHTGEMSMQQPIWKRASPGAAGTPGGLSPLLPWGDGKGGAEADPNRRCRSDRGDAWLRGRTLCLRVGRRRAVPGRPAFPGPAPGLPLRCS
jgi:hypothetical protein